MSHDVPYLDATQRGGFLRTSREARSWGGEPTPGRPHPVDVRVHPSAAAAIGVVRQTSHQTPAAGALQPGSVWVALPLAWIRAHDASPRLAVIQTKADQSSETVGDLTGRLVCLPPTFRTAALYGRVRLAGAGCAHALPTWSEIASLTPPPVPLGSKLVYRSQIEALARQMNARYGEPMTLDDLARTAGLSRYHFIRVFAAVMGDTPRRYIIAARLRAAADALIDTKSPITEVALDVGFNDISHFITSFRSLFGIPPGQWRAECEAGRPHTAREASVGL